MGFRSVYKRHTPFAMSLYEQVIQGSRKIVLDKVGDVLVYTYLYREGGYDWSGIRSVEFHIGGNKILEWDSNYLCGPHPILNEQVDSRTHTDASSLFLPLPIPAMLPVKNLRYHDIELIINWKYEPIRVRCFTMFAFVNEDLPSNVDMLIHQVKKFQVVDGAPMKLFGPVKYLVSDVLDQPTKMILDGQDVHIQDDAINAYYHTRFERLDFFSSTRYEYADIGVYNVRTSQRVGDKIYVFSSTSRFAKVFDTNKYFGSRLAYTDIDTGMDGGVWSSCTDGASAVYIADTDGNVKSVDGVISFSVPHNVYSLFYYNGILIMVGNQYISYRRDGITTTLFLGNDRMYDGAFQVSGSVDFGDAIILFRNDGSNGILVFKYDGIREYPLLLATDIYDRYSASIVVGGASYITSGFGDTFTRVQKQMIDEYMLNTTQYYTALVYDGSRYIYLYGETTVVRFDASKDRYSMFVPFCTDTNSTSSGSLNFDSIQNVVFKGCGNGPMYAVNYNILRITNGMAGLLYS